jgi:hypothetical protein
MDVVALRRGSVGKRLAAVQALRARRCAKLEEQNAVATRLDELLAKYQASSRRVLKSVEAAVTLSKRPGYIEYASHDAGTSDVGACRELVDRLDAVGRDIAALDDEIRREEEKNRRRAEDGDTVKPGSFAEWFARNGRPRSQQKGMVSQFVPSRQFVPHHGIGPDGRRTSKAAQQRSAAVTMVTGRLVA